MDVRHTLGGRTFLDVIRKVVREAIEGIEWEDEEEDGEVSDVSENKSHQVIFQVDCLVSQIR